MIVSVDATVQEAIAVHGRSVPGVGPGPFHYIPIVRNPVRRCSVWASVHGKLEAELVNGGEMGTGTEGEQAVEARTVLSLGVVPSQD